MVTENWAMALALNPVFLWHSFEDMIMNYLCVEVALSNMFTDSTGRRLLHPDIVHMAGIMFLPRSPAKTNTLSTAFTHNTQYIHTEF